MDRHPPVDRHVWQQNIEKIRQSIPNSTQPIVKPAVPRSESRLESRSESGQRAGQTEFLSQPTLKRLTRHPFAAIGTAWLLSVCIGSIAAVSIFKINPNLPAITPHSERQSEQTPGRMVTEAAPSAVPAENAVVQIETTPPPTAAPTSKSKKETLPLFSLGVVALGCAVGCLMLSRYFHASPSRQQPQFPSRSRLPRSASKTPRSSRQQKLSIQAAKQNQAESASPSAAAPASVVVVPVGEDHPLDWNGPSLADDLDIRQQRPLSRWL
jgi:hypothetical protein